MKKNNGFTLIEMLLAIAIFAMLGLAANAVLQTVMKSDETTRDFSARLKDLQQGFGVLQRDLGQMVARTSRNLEGGRNETFFQVGTDLLDADSDSETLIFYRLGWLNPNGLLPRGSIQAVSYVVHDGRLERWHYPYPDPEIDSEPIKTVLIDGVLSVKYAFFHDEKWVSEFEATQMPEAISIEIETENNGIIVRKFLLSQGIASDDGESGSSDTDDSDNDSTTTSEDDE